MLFMTAGTALARDLTALGHYSPKDMTRSVISQGAGVVGEVGYVTGMDAPFNVGPSACAETEPNELLTQADPMGLPDTCTGNVASFDPFDVFITYSGGTKDGIEDIFKVILPSSGKLDVSLTFSSGTADLDVFLFHESAGSLTIDGAGNETGSGPEHFVSTNTLSPGTYYVGVSAFSGSSAYSVSAFIVGGGGGTPPTAPSNLTATATSSSVIRLNWLDNSNNETEFRVEQRNSVGTFVDIGSAAANTTTINVTGFDPGETGTFRMRARNASGDSAYTNEASATTPGGGGGACTPSTTTVCLLNSRFRVAIDYRNQFSNPPGQTGNFVVQRLNPSAVNPDTAIFGFASPQDVEVVVRLVDARPFAPRFDLYYGGLTDVEYTVTVTDTQTGTTRQYHNNPGVVGGGVDRASFPAN
jgi:hypothetical protein